MTARLSPAEAAKQIVRSWQTLSHMTPGERRELIEQAPIDVGQLGEVPVGMDHLVRRMVVHRVEDSLIEIMRLLAIGRADAVAHVERLLAPKAARSGEPLLLSDIAKVVLPANPDAQQQVIEWMNWTEDDVLMLVSPHVEELFIPGIAHFTWKTKVQPWVRSTHPALPVEIVRPLAKLLSGGCTFPALRGSTGWQIRHHDDDLGIVRVDLTITRPTYSKFVENLAPKVLEMLGSTFTHRLLRELVARGWEARLRKQSEPERVVIPEGWPALAADLGIRGAEGLQRLRQAGRLLSLVELRPDGEAPCALLRLREDGRSHIEFRLLNHLRPGYVVQKRRDSDRSLVPLPVVIPPVASTKLMPRAYSYQMLLLFEMRKRATSFDGHRFLCIPEATRKAFARDVDLSDQTRRTVEDGWLAAGPEQFLEPGDGDHLRLGQAYETVDVMLTDSAARSASGRWRRQRVGGRGRA